MGRLHLPVDKRKGYFMGIKCSCMAQIETQSLELCRCSSVASASRQLCQSLQHIEETDVVLSPKSLSIGLQIQCTACV